ncbi:uncharacterized protein LOC114949082 isoform X3 [Acropora millepora]|uniref:uncharacterized protein LOC114949082 isoform X3 n=1 Tax=Acropora millepora TaxID=45264 RepID=UPI001CF0F734|nr:uncharacterized protein LOC114949082 isoform X3 [Acropora millepora]
MEASEGQHSLSEPGSDNKPPKLSFKLKKTGDVVTSSIKWRDVHLPVDILLLTVESCDFLSCFSLLDQPFRSYNEDLGYVYFGCMGEASDKAKLWVALMTSSEGAATPGGSLVVGQIAFRVLRPKAVFSVGTCISLDSEKVRRGDVVISSKLTTAEGFKVPVSQRLGHLVKDAPYGWVPPLENPGESEVNIHPDGDILSLSLTLMRHYHDICKEYPGAVAIETEGKGVYAAAYDTNIEWVIVKGVASYFHQSKSATSEWMSFASSMAASVVAKMLIDPTVFQKWRHYNQGSLVTETTTPTDQAVVAVNAGEQGPNSISEAVFHSDVSTVQQHIVGGDVSSGRENEIKRNKAAHPIVTTTERRQRQNTGIPEKNRGKRLLLPLETTSSERQRQNADIPEKMYHADGNGRVYTTNKGPFQSLESRGKRPLHSEVTTASERPRQNTDIPENSDVKEGKGDEKATDKEGKQYDGNKGKEDGGGAEADKVETQKEEHYEQDTYDDDKSGQISEVMKKDFPHAMQELQKEEDQDKVAIFEGTVTSEGIHIDIYVEGIHLTFPPNTVAEPTRIMVYRWNYGARLRLPHLMEPEAIVGNVIEISAATEVGALEFNGEVKLVLSHCAADLEGYERVMKRLVDTEKNIWEEIPRCEDIWKVSDIEDDYPCPNNVPYLFPVVRAGITKCSTYAVVSRLKLSPTYTITVSGGTFAHPDYPQVSIIVPQEAVATETRLSLQLQVQEVPQEKIQGRNLFAGPILRVLCTSRATFLKPVTIKLPVSLGNKLVNIPQSSVCRVRVFFLNSERETKEWIEISDELENPANYDGKLVTFKVQRFSGYTYQLDGTNDGSDVDAPKSSFISQQPLMANFFAYFDPKKRLGSRDILYLICCPVHRSEDVRQKHAGFTLSEATSRKYLIPQHDMAFVSVSGGIDFACSEDMEGFYIRFDGSMPHKAQLEVCLTSNQKYCKVEFRDSPDTTEKRNLLSTLNLNWSSSSTDRQVEETPKDSSMKLKVTLLSSEWGSTKGGLSTINRKLAIQLAKDKNVEVCMYLPTFSDEDKKTAAKCRVHLLKAKEKPGYDPIDWLAFIPRDHPMDVVIGHGMHLGRQILHIRESHPECKWVQVVHTDPEELGAFKTYVDPTAKGEKKYEAEVKLCQEADQVVAVGPKLEDACSHFCEREKIFNLTPGIFTEFTNTKQDNEERTVFHVLVFGRGDSEDFRIKGYDIAAKAVAKLKDPSFKLVFVGAPSGKEEEIRRMLLNEGILPRQLIVKGAKEREQLPRLFFGADLAIMPSRTEGFGLTALEALSAGLPVLVSANSGLGQALKGVPNGENVVLNSEEPRDWARKIKAVRGKKKEVRLEEARELREKYAKTYPWEKQCRRLVERMHEIVKS